jgi:hypothetical protein
VPRSCDPAVHACAATMLIVVANMIADAMQARLDPTIR